MRPLVLSLGFAIAAAGSGWGALGCKHATKLEGHWQGQSAVGVTPDTQINANVYAQGTEIVARGNQITISSPAGRNITATFTVDKEDATSLVIHTDRDNTSETFVFTEAKTMQWKVDERRSIVFKRID